MVSVRLQKDLSDKSSTWSSENLSRAHCTVTVPQSVSDLKKTSGNKQDVHRGPSVVRPIMGSAESMLHAPIHEKGDGEEVDDSWPASGRAIQKREN